ncbi:hypothetical protein Pla123a_00970 [Posidoniimonas polymericola]|uniref:DUF3299 domain-containing protein n=1 Tax=Posidoniimonas polymericola TaxID=2528002 RepID=A0A5C5ZDQ3_9BACT|nr:DUF3299 domain-containing protein [Posidoniimonas polymericola]TWT85290.1 hypothetical protein Pla123a_00970 [Posidoniimonas polymericola]
MPRLLATLCGLTGALLLSGCEPGADGSLPPLKTTADSLSDPAAAPQASDPPAETDAAADSAGRAQSESAEPRPSDPAPVARDPDRLIDQTFDDLAFDIEPDAAFFRSMLTPSIEALHGQRIRIRGYILPTAQKRGIKQFVLVRDNQECCFGPGAALYDCILVSMEPGESTEFSIRPVSVEGRLAVEEFPGPDGRPLAIYQMTGETVE